MVNENLAKDCIRQYIPASLTKPTVYQDVPPGTIAEINSEYHMTTNGEITLPDPTDMDIGGESMVLQLRGISQVTSQNRIYMVRSPYAASQGSRALFKVIELDGVKSWTLTSVTGTVDVTIRIDSDTITSERTITDSDIVGTDNVFIVMMDYNLSDPNHDKVILATTDETVGIPLKIISIVDKAWSVVSADTVGITTVPISRFAVPGQNAESTSVYVSGVTINANSVIYLGSIPRGDGTVKWYPINIEGNWLTDGDVQLDILNL